MRGTTADNNLFPNTTVLVWADMVNVLVATPGPTPRPLYSGLADTDLGTVMSQDLAMLRTAQRGLHQPGLTRIVLSQEECTIINFRRNLEAFLGITPSQMLPIGGS